MGTIDFQCECPIADFCERHQIEKGAREHQICQGVNVSEGVRRKYIEKWEQALPPPARKTAIRGLGDVVAGTIKVITGGIVKPCGSCRSRQGILNRILPLGARPPLIGVPINRDRLKTHILYHLMPLAGAAEPIWRRHIEWLKEVRAEFNGRCLIGVVTKGKKDTWEFCSQDTVRQACEGLDCELRFFTNRKKIGEGVSFPNLLAEIATDDPDEVFFYGHSKGVTHAELPLHHPPHLWADAMFETVFRNHIRATTALDGAGIAGSFRMPNGSAVGVGGFPWHYSGTFFAGRSVDVFRRNWEYLRKVYGCVEQWPATMFDLKTESACLFADNVANLYGLPYWKSDIIPALTEWRSNAKC